MDLKRCICVLLLVAAFDLAAAGGPKPKILVYSCDMPGFGRGVAEILQGRFGEQVEFVILQDPAELSALMSMPEVGCIVLAVLSGNEVKTLIDPLLAYFGQGGAAIGFQGCCVEQQVGRLSRDVFPAFGNSTGSGSVKAGIPVNEYVRDLNLEAFSDLPDQFDLLGQFFTYAANASRIPVEPGIAEGSRTVLFREKRTHAPLVIAYEGSNGSRSVSFTGCFVRSKETEKNYYGNLLEEPLFQTLLGDAVDWAMQGPTRHGLYGSSIGEMVQEERDRLEALRNHALNAEKERQRRKAAILLLAWALGLLAVSALVYRAFFRRPLRASG